MAVFKNIWDQITGDLEGKTFRKKVRHSEHFMRKYKAWGMDVNHLLQFPDDGIVEILDTENNLLYRVTVKRWREHGFKKDYGHSEQAFLTVSHFTVTNLNDEQKSFQF